MPNRTVTVVVKMQGRWRCGVQHNYDRKVYVVGDGGVQNGELSEKDIKALRRDANAFAVIEGGELAPTVENESDGGNQDKSDDEESVDVDAALALFDDFSISGANKAELVAKIEQVNEALQLQGDDALPTGGNNDARKDALSGVLEDLEAAKAEAAE